MKNADTTALDVVLTDFSPKTDSILEDVRSGLSMTPKALPSKYFYDEEGSRLFDRITELDAYYPTRSEVSIMTEWADEISARVGPNAVVIEYGSGSSAKTRILMDALESPAGYVPIDISREHLIAAARSMKADYPDLEVLPVCADYSQQISLPNTSGDAGCRLVFFPGSTIGNFDPSEAQDFLRRVAITADALLIGIDLVKEVDVMEAAYNDSEGVTAAFNLNLLRHINSELDANFDLDAFRHRAVFNPDHSRIEMHLVSTRDQDVAIGDQRYSFQKDEPIITEYSYKYTVEGFSRMAAESGLKLEKAWFDARRFFSVQLYRAEREA